MTDKTKELTNSTEKEIFMPTPHMEKWLDTAIQLETDVITDIANESRIDKSTWYTWLKVEGFIEWFNSEWDKRLKGHAWKLDAIGMRNSKRDFNYWKSMMHRTGKIVEDKGAQVQINNIIPILGGATKENS